MLYFFTLYVHTGTFQRCISSPYYTHQTSRPIHSLTFLSSHQETLKSFKDQNEIVYTNSKDLLFIPKTVPDSRCRFNLQVVLNIFFFCGTGIWTQGLTFHRKVVYHLCLSTNPNGLRKKEESQPMCISDMIQHKTNINPMKYSYKIFN
jgi:hypothetical protein